ncbi:MAG: N-formylglutamate amidohydrolase [Spirochaetales bacterium]|nr:N-formylglutamate amidohydrolase [Spirochaetales bacterium]
MSPPVVLHIPHSSHFIPDDVRKTIALSDDELRAEIVRLSDSHTEELYTGFRSQAVVPVVFPVCRLVTDPERFPEDSDEPMARHGQGVVYVKTQDGRALRANLLPGERRLLLDAWYHPHHRRLFELVQKNLESAGGCLIVDCHSFPSHPFPFEEPTDRPRPDVCIGADSYHTPASIKETLIDFFRSQGYLVDVNHPFAGALVPLAYYREEPRVTSVMIELNRRLYMDEWTGDKAAGFDDLKRKVTEAIGLLAGPAA